MFRKKIYKVHRALSLVIALPVLLWAASGFMHPLMTTLKPQVATQFLTPQVVDSSRMQQPLQTVLQKNNLSGVYNFRLVSIDTNWFYQVQAVAGAAPKYFSTRTGRPLQKGDELYAQYLAQQFVAGPPEPPKAVLPRPGRLALLAPEAPAEGHDCCMAAAHFVKKANAKNKVAGVVRVEQFSSEYKYVNRLLPVYKVNFERADGLRVYVETTTDRFAYAVDDQRAVFDRLFSLFHTWSWLEGAGKGKYGVMVLLLTATLLTTLMGLYIFFTTKAKPAKGNPVVNARRNHRWTSVLASLFTILFAFSGAFHAWEKIGEKEQVKPYTPAFTPAAALDLDWDRLQAAVDGPITDVRLARIADKSYWQVFTPKISKGGTPPPPGAVYVDQENYSVYPGGERAYAAFLASRYSGRLPGDSIALTPVTKFEGEYGFVNKRLPVWKVAYAGNGNERYYVETGTGQLATRVEDSDLAEGYSFALLHKHHFMDWAGKGVRDFSTMFWAMAQIAMVVVGLILWQKSKRRKAVVQGKKPERLHNE
ncbi:PepSY domain-containing protein [Paraflavisolibacter sp. H34]|uniref:PepSY domain-containing protein n=1 Tax=Huijunlia imazamoxiresistens TaxID=3127457 RepID=UPI003019AAB9